MIGSILGLILSTTTPAYSAIPASRPVAEIIQPTPLTAEQREEINKQARIELARRAVEKGDVLLWGQALFPEVFTVPFCKDLHEYFVSIRGMQYASTEAPRGHAKTTIACFLIPLYQALNEPESFKHYLNIQATEPKSLDINRAIKAEIEENEFIRAMYGNQVGPRWTDQQFVLRNGVVFTAKSAGQSLRGIKYRSLRPDYILVDDLYDEDEVNNLEQTKKINSWFWGTLYPARSKVRKSAIHVLGTAANKLDILESLKSKKRWESRTFRAIIDHEKNKVLWRELNSYADLLAELEDMPVSIFNREYQNERRDDSESIIKEAWIKYYEPSDLRFDERHILVATEIGVDPSVGAKPGSDATGAVRVLLTRHSDAPEGVFNFYVEEAKNERLSLNKRVDMVRKMADDSSSPVRRAHVEGISGFQDFVSELKRLTNIPVNLIAKVKDKLTNLENKSGYFENGRVFISKRIDPKLREMLVEQLTTNYPTHDDLRDALLLVLPELKKRSTWRPV